MTFGTILREHTMVASADMFYIAICYKNKANKSSSQQYKR